MHIQQGSMKTNKRRRKKVTQLCHNVCTTIAMSSIQAVSISKVRTLDTLVLSSPSVCLSSLNAKLSLGCLGPSGLSVWIPSGLLFFESQGNRWEGEADDLLTRLFAHLLMILACASGLPHRSAKPSEARMRNQGVSLYRLLVPEDSSKHR